MRYHYHAECGHTGACGREMHPGDVVTCPACGKPQVVERVCGRNF